MINSTVIESSTIKFQVQLTEAWIQKLADQKDFTISLNEQYQLHHFRVQLTSGQIHVDAEVVNKPDSFVELSFQPLWMVDEQQIQLENLDIKTKSKNLLLKSAGWVASKFLGEKIDRKIEEKVNQMFTESLQKLLSKPSTIPIKGHGEVRLQPKDIKILEIHLEEGQARLIIQVIGHLQVDLDGGIAL